MNTTNTEIKSNKERFTIVTRDKINREISGGEPEENITKFLRDNPDRVPDHSKLVFINAPTGTGKSYYITNTILEGYKYPSGEYKGKVLYLVGSTKLKDTLIFNNPEFMDFSSNISNFYNPFTAGVYVATYNRWGAELGGYLVEMDDRKLHPENYIGVPMLPSPTQYLIAVINDEWHELYQHCKISERKIDEFFKGDTMNSKGDQQYMSRVARMKSKMREYSNGCLVWINYLTNIKQHDSTRHIQVWGLTATPDNFINKADLQGKIHHLVSEGEVAGYGSLEIKEFTRYQNIKRKHIEGKCLIYCREITNMRKIQQYFVEELGYSPDEVICMWSENNPDKENKYTQEQIDFSNHLTTERNFGQYTIVIFNDGLASGLDIFDKDIQTYIGNGTGAINVIQCRGRIRGSIGKVYIKGLVDEFSNIDELPEGYLNRPLNKEEKQELTDYLQIKDSKGKPAKWNTLKKLLEASGEFTITETSNAKDPITGKRFKGHIISYKLED